MSETNTVSPLRQRMIEDMAARKLNPNTQRSHIYSCKRFAAWLKRSPDTATPDEVRGFQLHLIESGTSICNRTCDSPAHKGCGARRARRGGTARQMTILLTPDGNDQPPARTHCCISRATACPSSSPSARSPARVPV